MEKSIPFTKKSNVILIDGGYFMFYRYFATLRWYTIQKNNEQINIEELHTNKEFIEALENHAIKDIEKLKKIWNTKNIIICMDAPRYTVWRMDPKRLNFENYKKGRNNDTVNKIVLKHLLPFLEEYQVIKFIGEDYLEADDVIYLFSQKLLTNEEFNEKIIIITNDNDYLQLKCDRIELYNLQGPIGKDISVRSKGRPELDLLIKILKGDDSDNIKSICPKLGPKTALRVALMPEIERLAWIKAKGDDAIKNFEFNKKLIDFKEIPKDLCDLFNKKLIIEFK
jgi:5'-3' exonuclease